MFFCNMWQFVIVIYNIMLNPNLKLKENKIKIKEKNKVYYLQLWQAYSYIE